MRYIYQQQLGLYHSGFYLLFLGSLLLDRLVPSVKVRVLVCVNLIGLQLLEPVVVDVADLKTVIVEVALLL